MFDPPPVVTIRLIEQGLSHLKLKWGELDAEVPNSEYPEEDAAYQLHDWDHRGIFALRWQNGGIATFMKAQKRPEVASEVRRLRVAYSRVENPIEIYLDENGYPELPSFLDRRNNQRRVWWCHTYAPRAPSFVLNEGARH